MARRATAIKRERANGVPLLLVDSGNSLTGDRPPANTTQGATTIEYMNLMGYDAMTLGQADLKLGREALAQRIAESDFALLSANAVISGTDELFAPAYITRAMDGHRVAIVGLTGTWDPNPPADFAILDPLETVKKIIPEVAAQADIIIVLSEAGNPTDLKLVQAAPDIDLIVEGGQFQSFGRSSYDQATNTLFVHTDYPARGHAGRNLGKATVDFDAAGDIVAQSWQLIPLDPNMPDDPDMAQWRATK